VRKEDGKEDNNCHSDKDANNKGEPFIWLILLVA
jgi:hypothetical protein